MSAAADTFTADPSDALAQLLHASRRWPLLTADEEIALAKRIERGDLVARERLINSNVRLVVSVARRYLGQGLPMADLVQDGMLGLIRATEKFDWRRGFRFSTYATIWIRQAVQRGVENTSRTVRVPVYVSQRVRKIVRAERELTHTLGREPTDAELAAVTELTLEEIHQARTADRPPASLDLAVGDDGDTPLGALLPSPEPSPEDEAVGGWREVALAKAVDALPERERRVIQLRFGTDPGDGQPRTLGQAGKEIGLSAERTRQLEEQALRRLASSTELAPLRDAA